VTGRRQTPTGGAQVLGIFQRQQLANMITLSRPGLLPFMVLAWYTTWKR
jgi:hypothetical protein